MFLKANLQKYTCTYFWIINDVIQHIGSLTYGFV